MLYIIHRIKMPVDYHPEFDVSEEIETVLDENGLLRFRGCGSVMQEIPLPKMEPKELDDDQSSTDEESPDNEEPSEETINTVLLAQQTNFLKALDQRWGVTYMNIVKCVFWVMVLSLMYQVIRDLLVLL